MVHCLGWNGQSTTASTEIYEIDRDLWIDLESSEKYFSTSGGGITQFRSPVMEEWQVCSTGDVWRDCKGAQTEDVALDPLCYSLVEVEEMILKFVSDTLSLNEFLEKQVREQSREFCRCISIHQAARRKEKAEDCFNRAKIDALKSQIISFRVSEESESRSRAENTHIFSKGLYTIVHECVSAVQTITDVVQAEKAYLSGIIATSSQVRALQETIRACGDDLTTVQISSKAVFSDVQYFITGLERVVDLCGTVTTVRNDVECVGRGIAYLSAEAEQSKSRLSMHRIGIERIAEDSDAALCDVLILQQQLQDNFQSKRKSEKLIQTLCNDFEQIISEFLCLAASYKHLLQFEQTHSNSCAQQESNTTKSYSISKTNCKNEDG